MLDGNNIKPQATKTLVK